MAANPVAPVPELQLDIEKTPEETLVRCTGRITSATSDKLQPVRSLLPEGKRIVLDLTNISHIDSSGLGSLVGLYISSRRAHCELRLINLNQRIRELFRITKLAAVFEGHEEYLGWTPD